MRICVISREYPPETGWGGIATFSYHLAHGLKELGHDVEVVSLAAAAPHTVDDEGIKVHRVAAYKVPGEFGAVYSSMPYGRTVIEAASGLWQKFIQLHEQKPFDVIDAPDLLADGLYPSLTGVAPLVVRLYTPHFKFMADKLHNTSTKFDHQLVGMLERIALLQCDAITSPSRDLANFVCRDVGVPKAFVKIIRNPIDPSVFSPEGPRALPASDTLKVLFVGRLEERKGISYLVHAIPAIVQACPNAEFFIIGDDTINTAGGQGSTLRALRDFLISNNVEDRVKFLGRVPLKELPAYYRSADVCVVPSLYDNSPYTCLEALSCGKPVIGTESGGTKEYVQHEHSGVIVPPRDSVALAVATIELLRDSEKRKRMGEAARADVLAKFQRTAIAQQTINLYEEAAERFRRRKRSVYMKAADHALPDAAVLLYSFDKMMYDLCYQESFFFRVRHWLRMAAARPKLFAARAVLRAARLATKTLLPANKQDPALVRWLEAQVKERVAERKLATADTVSAQDSSQGIQQ